MNCKSSVRSCRETKDVNVSDPIWDRYRHMLWETCSQKQQFALWVITSEDMTNSSDPHGMGWSCMRWPDCSSSQQPDGTGDQKPVRNPVSCPIKKKNTNQKQKQPSKQNTHNHNQTKPNKKHIFFPSNAFMASARSFNMFESMLQVGLIDSLSHA